MSNGARGERPILQGGVPLLQQIGSRIGSLIKERNCQMNNRTSQFNRVASLFYSSCLHPHNRKKYIHGHCQMYIHCHSRVLIMSTIKYSAMYPYLQHLQRLSFLGVKEEILLYFYISSWKHISMFLEMYFHALGNVFPRSWKCISTFLEIYFQT